MAVLRFEDVWLAFGGPPVLAGVSFALDAGHLMVVEGRSGSGKSSLLALAAGLQAPDQGQVLLHGEPVRAGALARRTNGVGLVFQHLNLLPELSVAENVALPLQLANVPRHARQARTRSLLETFGITPLADRRPGSLSGGEQQRVAIARALALRPGLLLVDEPTSNLDLENARQAVRALQTAADQGAAVLVATHDPVFAGAGTRLRLQGGRLLAEAPA